MSHLLDVEPVRRRDHLRGETLRRVQAFAQLLIDQMESKGKLLAGQFPDVSNVTQLPGKADRRALRKGQRSAPLGDGYF